MTHILLLFGILSIFDIADAYVLLQVRKDDKNQSNVDALIHKVVPSDEISAITDKLARKHSNKRFQVRSRADEEEQKDTLMAIDYDKENKPKERKHNLTEEFGKLLKHFLETPYYRSGRKGSIKPELIHFRSGKPSLMFELNSDTIVKVLNALLSSGAVEKYTDQLANKAAVIFRSMMAAE